MCIFILTIQPYLDDSTFAQIIFAAGALRDNRKDMMAKTETIDRFTISIDVDSDEMGLVVATLNRLPLKNKKIRFDMTTEVRTFNNKTVHEVKAEEFLAAWVADHPTFKASDAVKHFRDNGRNDGACYGALRMLCEKKILKKLEAGHYARADIKQIAAPKKLEREHHEIDHREFILRYARQHHGRMSTAKLRAHFDLHGRKPTSVGGALNVLLQKKMIKSLGDGEYELRAKPETKAKAPPPDNAAPPLLPLAKLNGSTAHGEAVTHG
jgi:hypothetical protein